MRLHAALEQSRRDDDLEGRSRWVEPTERPVEVKQRTAGHTSDPAGLGVDHGNCGRELGFFEDRLDSSLHVDRQRRDQLDGILTTDRGDRPDRGAGGIQLDDLGGRTAGEHHLEAALEPGPPNREADSVRLTELRQDLSRDLACPSDHVVGKWLLQRRPSLLESKCHPRHRMERRPDFGVTRARYRDDGVEVIRQQIGTGQQRLDLGLGNAGVGRKRRHNLGRRLDSARDDANGDVGCGADERCAVVGGYQPTVGPTTAHAERLSRPKIGVCDPSPTRRPPQPCPASTS